MVVIVPAVAVKPADVAPAGTVTEPAGTGSNALLLDRDTAVPPVGAAPLSVTVQLVPAPEFKLVGLHVSDDNATGGADPTRLIVAVTGMFPGTVAVA